MCPSPALQVPHALIPTISFPTVVHIPFGRVHPHGKPSFTPKQTQEHPVPSLVPRSGDLGSAGGSDELRGFFQPQNSMIPHYPTPVWPFLRTGTPCRFPLLGKYPSHLGTTRPHPCPSWTRTLRGVQNSHGSQGEPMSLIPMGWEGPWQELRGL